MQNPVREIGLLLKALEFAAWKHQHQRRKNEEEVPYINHLIAVSETLWEIGTVYDIDILVAGILHDTIEDTDTSPQELEEVFGKNIRSIVEEVTDDKRLPKEERKRLQIEQASTSSFEARQVKLADKICNVRDIVDAPPAQWPLSRRKEYVDWAENVVNGLRGSNARLERHFDQICLHARQQLDAEEPGA